MKFWKNSVVLGIMMLASNTMAMKGGCVPGPTPHVKSFQPQPQPQQQVIRAMEPSPYQPPSFSDDPKDAPVQEAAQHSEEVKPPQVSKLRPLSSRLKDGIKDLALCLYIPFGLSLHNFIMGLVEIPREDRVGVALTTGAVASAALLGRHLLRSGKAREKDSVAKAEKSGGVKKYIKKHFHLISAALFCGFHTLDVKANKTSYFQGPARSLRAAFFAMWMWACERRAEHKRAQMISESASTKKKRVRKVSKEKVLKQEKILLKEEYKKLIGLLSEDLQKEILSEDGELAGGGEISKNKALEERESRLEKKNQLLEKRIEKIKEILEREKKRER